MRVDGGRMRFVPAAGHARSRSRPIWCCWPWASLGPERGGLLSDLGVRLTDRGNVWRDDTLDDERGRVFTAGDMQRGQSLIVWAIAEGRAAARSVDTYLMGASALPTPLHA